MGFSKVRRHCIVLGMGLGLTGLCQAQGPRPALLRNILVVGDSISAEYGLKRGSGWVALMEQKIDAEKMPWKVVNASISGDTSSGGRSRLLALLKQHQPKLVLIELGGNDALRGLPLESTQQNLLAMVKMVQDTGATTLLLGMQVPPNYGQDYAARFAAVFKVVAKTTKSMLVPFLLKGIADGPQAELFFQSDRIHPTEAAQPLILNNVWPILRKLIA